MLEILQLGNFTFLFTHLWHPNSQNRKQGRAHSMPLFPVSSQTNLRTFVFPLLYTRLRQLSLYPEVCQLWPGEWLPTFPTRPHTFPPGQDWSSSTEWTLLTITEAKQNLPWDLPDSTLVKTSPPLFYDIGLTSSALQSPKSLFWLFVDFYQVYNHQPVRPLPDVQLAVLQVSYTSQNKGCNTIPAHK